MAVGPDAAVLGMVTSLDVMLRQYEDIDRLEQGIQQALDTKPASVSVVDLQ